MSENTIVTTVTNTLRPSLADGMAKILPSWRSSTVSCSVSQGFFVISRKSFTA